MKKPYLGIPSGAAKGTSHIKLDTFGAAASYRDDELQRTHQVLTSLEFGLLKFSFGNIELSDIPQSLLSTNAAGIIPVHLGSTAQSVLFFQMLNHDFTSSDAV
jgi:hypothetical protein